MHAELFDPADLIETIDAALAHYGRAGGHERRQALGRRQVDREGFEIAIIDADQLRARGDGGTPILSPCAPRPTHPTITRLLARRTRAARPGRAGPR